MVANGQKIVYIRQDGGQILPAGLHLKPGVELTVGKDVSVELADRLVATGRCGIVGSAPAPAEVTPAAASTVAGAAASTAPVTAAAIEAEAAKLAADVKNLAPGT